MLPGFLLGDRACSNDGSPMVPDTGERQPRGLGNRGAAAALILRRDRLTRPKNNHPLLISFCPQIGGLCGFVSKSSFLAQTRKISKKATGSNAAANRTPVISEPGPIRGRSNFAGAPPTNKTEAAGAPPLACK